MFRFSNCGKQGNKGPSLAELSKCYDNTSISVTVVGEGIQAWTVPKTGKYLIHAAGAAGTSACISNKHGNGVEYSAYFYLVKNDVLFLLVGQQGFFPASNWGGAGGGASFVTKKVETSEYKFSFIDEYIEPLLIAAGGGGSGDCNDAAPIEDGFPGNCDAMDDEGGVSNENKASGGAGFSHDSGNGLTKSFLNGGTGSQYSGYESYGGFGCGGNSNNAGGGGGGYRGGNSGVVGGAGYGGYSFNKGKKVSCSAQNSGDGFIIITQENQRANCHTRKRSDFQISHFLFILLVS